MRQPSFIFFACKIFVIYFYCCSSPIYISGKSYNGNFIATPSKNFWRTVLFDLHCSSSRVLPITWSLQLGTDCGPRKSAFEPHSIPGCGNPWVTLQFFYVHGQFKSLLSHEVWGNPRNPHRMKAGSFRKQCRASRRGLALEHLQDLQPAQVDFPFHAQQAHSWVRDLPLFMFP